MKPQFILTSKRHLWGWRYRFRLVAPNGETISTSEPYNSKEAAEAGAYAVKRHAPTAPVVWETRGDLPENRRARG